MPQFDQFSFFNQVSWFFFLFFNFYFLITYFFIPTICYNIKFRKKKLIFNNKKKDQINFEKNHVFFFLNNLYKNFYYNFEIFISKKISIYNEKKTIQIKEKPLISIELKKKINIFLNKEFLFLKKIFLI